MQPIILRSTSLNLIIATIMGCGTEMTTTPEDGVEFSGRLEGAVMSCFYPIDDLTMPAATIEYRLEVFDEVDMLRTRLTFSPTFVDNTYGNEAIGWLDSKKGDHSFKDLYGSDHAQLIYTDASGSDALDFKMDYLSEDETAPSGFRTLGVSGGDGKMVAGDPAVIRRVATSLDRNLNERGLDSYTEDSPPTDARYNPPPEAPEWNYRVVYEAWVADAAFGAHGFESVRLDFVHASPSKTGNNTEAVAPAPCPDGWCPGGCDGEDEPSAEGGDPEGELPDDPPA